MRRRLKFASLYHDRLLLEAGILTVQGGPSAWTSMVTQPTKQYPARWQTPRERNLAQQQRIQWAVGRETTPGVPADTMHQFLDSETTVNWVATLHPFADELPPSAGWVHFVPTGNLPSQADTLATRWTWADERNPCLEQAMPVRFVRQAVIRNANRDLAGAASEGVSVTIDAVHTQVVAQRFRDDQGWRMHGYVVPILLPQVGSLPWQAIADLRCDKNLERFRAVLREVEQEATREAAGGDIEAAAHHAYERHLADATGKLEGIRGPTMRATTGFAIGATAGFTTSGITGPIGPLAGAALGVIPGAILDIRSTIRRRRRNGWVGLYQKASGGE